MVTNQWIDQLTIAWTDFSNQGMLIADPVFGSYIYFLIIYDIITVLLPALDIPITSNNGSTSQPELLVPNKDINLLEEAVADKHVLAKVQLTSRPSEFCFRNYESHCLQV